MIVCFFDFSNVYWLYLLIESLRMLFVFVVISCVSWRFCSKGSCRFLFFVMSRMALRGNGCNESARMRECVRLYMHVQVCE